MKVIILAALLSAAAFSAPAQTVTCKPQADEKKVVGAALKSFTTKCERDAKAACEASAKEKKLRAPLKRASRRNARVTPLGRKPWISKGIRRTPRIVRPSTFRQVDACRCSA